MAIIALKDIIVPENLPPKARSLLFFSATTSLLCPPWMIIFYLTIGWTLPLVMVSSTFVALCCLIAWVRLGPTESANWRSTVSSHILCSCITITLFVNSSYSGCAKSPLKQWMCVSALYAVFIVGKFPGLIWTIICLVSLTFFYTPYSERICQPYPEDSFIAFLISLSLEVSLVVALYCISVAYKDVEEKWLKTLSKASHERDEALQSRQEFLATVSHELRTPLAGILGESEALSEHVRTGRFSAEVERSVKTILECGNQLLAHINNIMVLNNAKHQLNNRHYRLDTNLVQPLKTLTAHLGHHKGVRARFVVSRHVPQDLFGEPEKIIQAVTNLISNAVGVSESGGMLRIEVDCDALFLYIRIKDRGPGVSEEEEVMESYFKAFVQGARMSSGGTGLGLYITRKVVRLMDGDVSCSNRRGGGAVFCVKLPLIEADTDTVNARKKELSSPSLSSNLNMPFLKVLVVEDEAVNMRLSLRHLSKFGITRVRTASDGIEAVDFATSEQFHIILMDLSMSNMGGIEATKLIRQYERENGILPPAQIIPLTAHAFTEEQEKCSEVGMNGFLTKPYSRDQLRSTILDAVARLERQGAILHSSNSGEWY